MNKMSRDGGGGLGELGRAYANETQRCGLGETQIV